MTEFVRDIVGQQVQIVLWTRVDLNSVLHGKSHRSKTWSRRHEYDVVSQFVLGNLYQIERRFRTKCSSRYAGRRDQHQAGRDQRRDAAHGPRRIIQCYSTRQWVESPGRKSGVLILSV